MGLEDQIKSQLKRVNPFPGLIIDADIWRDAHEYHRNQQKLHVLSFHGYGILQGLEISASNPPDLSVTIQPGIGVDPEGNMIVVTQPQHYRLQTKKTGVIYLIIQFREVPMEPFQPPNGGQATRILEAYRIQETDKFPTEPFLELARIDLNPDTQAVKDATSPSSYGKNEIILAYRKEIKTAQVEKSTPAIERKGPTPPETRTGLSEKIILGHMVLGEGGKELHLAGLRNLVREIDNKYNFAVALRENVPLDSNLTQLDVLYLTGSGHFEITPDKQTLLSNFLQSGGVLFAEGCYRGAGEEGIRQGKEFGLAVNRLAGQLKYRLGTIPRTHPLLSTVHVFSEVPPGAQPAIILAPLEGLSLFYSGSDYGCAWQGGYPNASLAREIIRGASEMGVNIMAYGRMTKSTHH